MEYRITTESIRFFPKHGAVRRIIYCRELQRWAVMDAMQKIMYVFHSI